MLTVAAEFGLLKELWLECFDVIEVKVSLNTMAHQFGLGPETYRNHRTLLTSGYPNTKSRLNFPDVSFTVLMAPVPQGSKHCVSPTRTQAQQNQLSHLLCRLRSEVFTFPSNPAVLTDNLDCDSGLASAFALPSNPAVAVGNLDCESGLLVGCRC